MPIKHGGARTSYLVTLLDSLQLSDEVSKAALRKIVTETVKRARKRVPRGGTRKDKTWMARKNTRLFRRIKGGVSKKRYKQVGWVAARAPHAHLVTEGTKAHLVTSNKPHGRLVIKGHVVPAPVHHPGAKANPFLTEAVNDVEPRVNTLVTGAIEAAAAKVKKINTFSG